MFSIVETREQLLHVIDRLRPDQAEVVRGIVRAVREGKKYICINAPTGFGKTVIGISAGLYMLLRGHVPLIFVRTRSQLSAYVRDCAKFLHAIPSLKLCKAEVCSVYRADSLVIPCGVCRLLRDVSPVEPYSSIYERMLRAVERGGVHDPYILAEDIKRQRVVCPYYFFRLLHRVSGLHLHVCTYPYLAKLWPLLYDELRQEYGGDVKPCAIVDEAHNLEDSMFLTYATVTESALARALKETEKIVAKYDEELAETAKLIVEAVYGYYMLCRKEKLPEEKVLDPAQLIRLVEQVTDLETAISVLDTASEVVLQHYRRIIASSGEAKTSPQLRTVADFMHALAETDVEVTLVWTGTGLDVRALDVDMRRLFEDFDHVVLMSGTLPPEDYVEKAWRLGKKRLTYIDLSGRKFGNVRKIVDTTVTSRYVERSPEMLRTYADKIARIYQQAEKHVLAVAPSYELAHAFALLLERERPDIADNVIVEEENMKFGEVEEEARKSKHLLIIAVAGGKLCEGVELTMGGRSLLSDIVIAGIPYQPPTSYNRVLESRVARKSGLDPKYIRNVKAWILVRQALGRGVRHPEDRCTWWLLDYRFLDRFWQEKLLGDDYEIVNV